MKQLLIMKKSNKVIFNKFALKINFKRFSKKAKTVSIKNL